MYEQMEHMDLIAQNSTHYVELVHKLLTNDEFYTYQAEKVGSNFYHKIHQNEQVAGEWLSFIMRLFK